MIKISFYTLIFLLYFSSLSSKAQHPILWGMNEIGGVPDSGSISAGSIYNVNFATVPSAINPKQMHYFKNTSPGGGPSATPIQGTDGKIYGSSCPLSGGTGL
jgi:hypothetical protein